MAIYDLSEKDLERIRGPLPECPTEFDAFWKSTLAETRSEPLRAVFTPVESGLITVETFDVSFSGWGGQRIRAWLSRPRHPGQRNGACVVEFSGYEGGRGYPHEWLFWPAAGYAHLVMDTRGQGGGYRTGDTPDSGSAGHPHAAGFLTQGIASPETFFYRRVYADAARAIEAAMQAPDVDPTRVVAAGTSQGGGIAIAAAALVPEVAGLVSAVPFLCHFRRAAELATEGPYAELARYCAQRPSEVQDVFQTLSYFDGVHFATRAKAPSIWSIALMDRVCPPSTTLAAAHAYAGPAQIRIHPFADHEDGRAAQDSEALDFLSGQWAAQDDGSNRSQAMQEVNVTASADS